MDNDDGYGFSLGWQVGVVADIGSKYFFFHPGIMFIGKGTDFTDSKTSGTGNYANTVDIEATASAYYIEAPLLLSFKPIPELRIDVGHYVSYGLFGTMETTSTVKSNTGTNSSTTKQKTFKFLDDFDFGLSFGLGVEIKNYFVGVNYEFGLEDIAEDGPETKNQTWALKFGYNF